jgi:hypothetical protein
MNMDNSINYLVGRKAKLDICIKPFSNEVVLFLDFFSKHLNILNNKKKFVDVQALSFFCRKKNILNLKQKYTDNSVRFGLGKLFHITPSNIPTNFAYSLIFGLISGNSNIVKIPSKKYEEIELICESINKVLKNKNFSIIRNMIAIVRYNKFDLWTKNFSMICDARLIWGGDKTIHEVKQYETKINNIDIPFSDRYSISLINSEQFLKLNDLEKKNLIKNFYNDTYSVDQNACSSPHLVLWKGSSYIKAKNLFWNLLSQIVKQNYNPPLISSIDSYSRLIKELITNKEVFSNKRLNKSLYVVTLKKLTKKFLPKKTVWGFFFESRIKDFKEINYVANRKLQTLTYFGFSRENLKIFFKKNNLNGIDRVVPIGQALNINLIWDGYDLNRMLSREIDFS